ncbi:MAG: histidine kinase [Micavibrio sp.]|nr:MAG: histidine kinase [Micavibrio sp.]
MGTAIKKNRWFRLGAKPPEIPEIDNLLDLYWGGPERRITGLTLRIIGVNAIALIILLVGILYLGQYQEGLIETKLENFKIEIELLSAAISEGAIEQSAGNVKLLSDQAKNMTERLSFISGKRIRLFDAEGALIADSIDLLSPEQALRIANRNQSDEMLDSVKILKSMAGFIISLLPDRRVLPLYPNIQSDQAADYPDVYDAMTGQISLSAWYDQNGGIFLSAAAPLHIKKDIVGALLITRKGKDIEDDIGKVWLDVLRVFLATLVVTVLLSIYLSGVIARPLRKLAGAAEDVRRGQGGEIPDLSNRHDEIGDLSIVLRDMTQALWERMDSIEHFAADVSHELKNPLTSLRSAIETASVVKKKEDRDKLFKIIMHDLERLDRLISDISNASRLDAELSREVFKPIKIKGALTQLIDAYKNPLERKKDHESEKHNSAKIDTVEVQLTMSGIKDIQVWGFETRLIQVFENLISNAVSFSPKKGVVSIRITAQGQRVRITVEDEGPGIPHGRLENIFERFYSERPEHEDYGRHSGLGLSICRQIMTAHQGRIFAENIKDNSGKVKGARFVVVLNTL